jgi:hemerythrin-like domain-containing protein
MIFEFVNNIDSLKNILFNIGKKLDAHEILVEEHVIIHKMLDCLKIFEENLEKNSLDLLNIVIDFFKIYADKNHHGKEESILFSRLENKPLKKEEKELLEELLDEHRQGRELVVKLGNLKLKKDIKQIKLVINKMIALYKQHIEKENVRFFIPAFKYFSIDEKKQILEEFYQVDRKIFYEKYLQIVNNFKTSIKK